MRAATISPWSAKRVDKLFSRIASLSPLLPAASQGVLPAEDRVASTQVQPPRLHVPVRSLWLLGVVLFSACTTAVRLRFPKVSLPIPFSPYERTLYMDLDVCPCGSRGMLDALFDELDEYDLSVALDKRKGPTESPHIYAYHLPGENECCRFIPPRLIASTPRSSRRSASIPRLSILPSSNCLPS